MGEQTKTPASGRTGMPQRQRPRWAQVVHHLGDDLRWALSAWCEFPRPVTRITAAAVSAAGAYAFDVDDSLHTLFTVLTD